MDKIGIMIEWIASITESIIILYFVQVFYNKKFDIKSLIFSFSVLLIISQILMFSYTIQTFCNILALVLIQIVYYKTHISNALFISIILNFISACISFVGINITRLISGKDVIYPNKDIFYWRLFLLIFTKLLFALFIEIFLRLSKKIKLKINGRFGLPLFVCLYITLETIGDVFINANIGIKYRIELFIVFLALIIFFVIIFFLVYKLYKLEIIENENKLIYYMLEEQKNRFIYTEKLYNEARIIRHDTKHYFNIIRNLIETGEYDEVKNYIDNLLHYKFQPINIIFIHNTILDSVINEKMSYCSSRKIELSVKVKSKLLIENNEKAVDIALVLYNLLDNAIEATIKYGGKKIEMELFSVNSMNHVFITNQIKKSILENNSNMHTSKKEKELHGFGIKSVYVILEKYDGKLIYSEDGNRFITHISFSG